MYVTYSRSVEWRITIDGAQCPAAVRVGAKGAEDDQSRQLQHIQHTEKKYGDVSSWAVWNTDYTDSEPGRNIKDLSMFASPNLAKTLETLNTGFVFVGLNRSGRPKDGNAEKKPDKPKDPWFNFHAGRNDFKLRYALRGTRYWGSYMTDAIKDLQETDSVEVEKTLGKEPERVEENLKGLREELELLELLGGRPVLVALGYAAEKKLRSMRSEGYEVVRILHPAARNINKEDYRKRVLEVLDDIQK